MTTLTATAAGPLDRELAFTETFRRLQGEHIAIREALCLRQARHLHPIRPGDLFAGRHVKAALDPDGLMVVFGLVYTIKFWPRPGESLTGKEDPRLESKSTSP